MFLWCSSFLKLPWCGLIGSFSTVVVLLSVSWAQATPLWAKVASPLGFCNKLLNKYFQKEKKKKSHDSSVSDQTWSGITATRNISNKTKPPLTCLPVIWQRLKHMNILHFPHIFIKSFTIESSSGTSIN